MKVTHRFGRLKVALEDTEAQLLAGLLQDLSTVLGTDVSSEDPVTQRLFPSAYPDDDKAAQEFRSLTEGSLRDERLDRVAACATELAAGAGDLDLSDDEVANRWIQVLNDLRLTLGVRLDISEDDPEFDPQAPDAQPRAVYYWLTAVQDSVVTALMR